MSKKFVKTIKTLWNLAIPILAIALVVLGYFLFRARGIGNNLGTFTGSVVGKAVGSYKGVTEGIEEGANAGKEDGLSAEDTETQIQNSLQGEGKLLVLTANTSIADINKLGKSYEALYVINADINFFVDLTEAKIRKDSEGIHVIVPEPQLDLMLNMDKTEVLYEKQKFTISKKDQDGIDSYLNSLAEIVSNAKAGITNYDFLMDQAKRTAESKVQLLVESLSLEDLPCFVEFATK